MPPPPRIEVDDAIVLLLGTPDARGASGRIEGVTRLEKLLFLLEREGPFRQWLTERADFRSHRFGPFSSKVYQAADTLAAAGLVRDSASLSASPEEGWETTNLLVDEADPYATRNFDLTDRGIRYYEALLRELPPDAEDALREFKSRFAALPLRQLVRYVYQRFPEYTDKSEIKDDVLK
jgi:hypothetical protein